MKSLAKYSNSTMTLVMLAIFLVLVGVASRYPAQARFMPYVVGIPPILLCLLQLIIDARIDVVELPRQRPQHVVARDEVERHGRLAEANAELALVEDDLLELGLRQLARLAQIAADGAAVREVSGESARGR